MSSFRFYVNFCILHIYNYQNNEKIAGDILGAQGWPRPGAASATGYGIKVTKWLLFHLATKSGANLMWVDEAGSVIAPELKRLVIIRSNLDMKSTHQRVSASEIF